MAKPVGCSCGEYHPLVFGKMKKTTNDKNNNDPAVGGETKTADSTSQSPKKTLRRNIVNLHAMQNSYTHGLEETIDLSSDEAKRKALVDYPAAELDRFMIALLRTLTLGRKEYRQMAGMHGGGFGTTDDAEQINNWKICNQARDQRPLMKVKVDLDKERYIVDDWFRKHNAQNSDDNGMWPSHQANVTLRVLKPEHEYLGHIFCWHSQAPFLLWHRPLMVEIERLLQNYDPLFPGTHEGADALGLHYYDWHRWDGETLPTFINHYRYTLKTDVFREFLQENDRKHMGYDEDHRTITNPLYQWFAPMEVEHQLRGTFPSEYPDENTCTTRDPAYSDMTGGTVCSFPWPLLESERSIEGCVHKAMRATDFLTFCTVRYGGSHSIEHAHNKFHNRIGGINGTMTSNQSLFDPLFLLHHSNVERLLVSWQQYHLSSDNNSNVKGTLEKIDWLMDERLYPWTKPDCVQRGQLSWNTKADVDINGNAAPNTKNDATVRDWWDYENLTYTYDDFEPITGSNVGMDRVMMKVQVHTKGAGEFSLVKTDINRKVIAEIDNITIMSGNKVVHGVVTSPCAMCRQQIDTTLTFDVTGYVTVQEYEKYEKDLKKGIRSQNDLSKLRVLHNDLQYTPHILSVKGHEEHIQATHQALATIFASKRQNQRLGHPHHSHEIHHAPINSSPENQRTKGRRRFRRFWDCRQRGPDDVMQ